MTARTASDGHKNLTGGSEFDDGANGWGGVARSVEEDGLLDETVGHVTLGDFRTEQQGFFF